MSKKTSSSKNVRWPVIRLRKTAYDTILKESRQLNISKQQYVENLLQIKKLLKEF